MNKLEQDIELLERIDIKYFLSGSIEQSNYIVSKADEANKALEHILSDYKKVVKENKELKEENEILKNENAKAWEEWNNLEQGSYEEEQKLKQQIKELQKENAELKNEHSCLINRIENKIDKLDYEMERAKRRNDQERANYCWDFLINFKNLLESEE